MNVSKPTDRNMNSDSDLTDLSSELSSVRYSLSPPPDFGYPSPQSSQDYSANAPESRQGSCKRSLDAEDLPTVKKRKRIERAPRTTVHLDLRAQSLALAIDQTPQLDLLLKTLRKRRKIVVIAGAGISTSAGIPDFRSANGLFNILKSTNRIKSSGKHLFDASVYQTDDSTTYFHEMVRTLSKRVSEAEPTAFHQMLATLASEGRLMRLYTQNVDGIDTSLPPLATRIPLDRKDRKGPWPRTVQLHGSLEKMVCSKCHTLKEFDPVLFDGPVPPLCTICEDLDKVRTESAGKRSHGIGRLRPRMVLYNESNPDAEAIGMVTEADLRARPDAVIVVGTSLEIPGVKRIVREMCGVVRSRRDGVAIWINRGPPPIAKGFEDCWDLVVAGDCDEVARHANMRYWNDEGNDYKECTESEVEAAKRKGTDVKVIVETVQSKRSSPMSIVTPKKASTSPKLMMMTPVESPKSKAIELSIPPFKFPLVDKKAMSKPKGWQKSTAKRMSAKASKAGSGTSALSKGVKQSDQSNIMGAFKVTKNLPTTVQAPFTPKKDKSSQLGKCYHPSPTGPEKARRLLESINESPQPPPMSPISPTSAKRNASISSVDSEAILPKLARVEIPLKIEIPGKEISSPDGRRLKRMSEEIVSPTGNTPSGMANILH